MLAQVFGFVDAERFVGEETSSHFHRLANLSFGYRSTPVFSGSSRTLLDIAIMTYFDC